MNYRVLLIDDEPSALEGLLMWIDWKALGFEVCATASNGSEGLALIRQLEPDLVVTDINMPVMNGLEMIAAWQGEEKTTAVKFAILSGYSEFEYAKTAIHYGINHYLLKPVFPEEVAEELKGIHQELEQENRKLKFSRIASLEEIVTLIKGILHEKPSEAADLSLLAKVEAERNQWNFCLIQTRTSMYAEIRGEVASLLSDEDSIFLLDLETGSLGLVYGYSEDALGDAKRIERILDELAHRYSRQQMIAATGEEVSSLSAISASYRTAKEAAAHHFYRSGSSGVLSYAEIADAPFSYHYDHIKFMDDILKSINTLDLAAMEQTIDSAVRSFREMRTAPEIVRKVVIHMMYRIVELTPAASTESGPPQTEIRIPELLDPMITLEEVTGQLRSFGEACIRSQTQEQTRNSQGIVQEINRYIEQHYHESLSIKKLSEVFYLHPVYLGQLLIKKNGIPFNEQLHNLRIDEAVRLLRENKLKNWEVAEKVGYVNYGQFLKQFEKKMKMSPNEYKHS